MRLHLAGGGLSTPQRVHLQLAGAVFCLGFAGGLVSQAAGGVMELRDSERNARRDALRLEGTLAAARDELNQA